MKKNLRILILGVLAGLMLISFFIKKSGVAPLPELQKSNIAQEKVAAASKTIPHGQASVADADLPPIEYPSRVRVRSEVIENPHGTPPSLIILAKAIATHMQKALRSEEYANQFAPELVQCVLNADRNPSNAARSFCLFQLDKLSNRFSSVREKYLAIQTSIPTKVAKGLAFLKY